MNWFSRKKDSDMIVSIGAVSKASESHDRRAEDKYAHLEKLAREEEVKALSEKDALFAKAKELHAADLAGYTFECDHWGYFLNIRIARLSNTPKKDGYGVGQYYSGSINLNLCGAIELVEGRKPDLDGVLSYAQSHQYKDGASIDSVIRRDVGFPQDRAMFFKAIPEQGSNATYGSFHFIGHNSYVIKLTTANWPRAAKDDEIRVPDIRAVIYAPAGMGAAVYKKILKATGVQKP